MGADCRSQSLLRAGRHGESAIKATADALTRSLRIRTDATRQARRGINCPVVFLGIIRLRDDGDVAIWWGICGDEAGAGARAGPCG